MSDLQERIIERLKPYDDSDGIKVKYIRQLLDEDENMKEQEIKVFFKDSKCDTIPQNLWDDYEYIDGLFVVKRKGAWIGIYNMDVIACVVVG